MRKSNYVDYFIIALLGVLAFIIVLPFYSVLIVSLSSFKALNAASIYLIPTSMDFSNYALLLKDFTVPRAALVSFFITVVGTAYSITLTACLGYSLSKKELPGRKILTLLIIFTMFFDGGLVPFYLVTKSIGLVDSLFVMILPWAVNTTYVLLMKSYFMSIPLSLQESAQIDGASVMGILVRIMIPLSMPIIATLLLFYAVAKWNDYYLALLFINSPVKKPLQIILREMLVNMTMSISSAIGEAVANRERPMSPQALRNAMVILTSIPIIIIYPSLQKYFTKGIIIGSVKE